MNLPTGKYKDCQHWDAARLSTNLAEVADDVIATTIRAAAEGAIKLPPMGRKVPSSKKRHVPIGDRDIEYTELQIAKFLEWTSRHKRDGVQPNEAVRIGFKALDAISLGIVTKRQLKELLFGCKSFEAYCKSDRSRYAKRYCNYLIAAADVRKLLPKTGTAVPGSWTEASVRPLLELSTPQSKQAASWYSTSIRLAIDFRKDHPSPVAKVGLSDRTVDLDVSPHAC